LERDFFGQEAQRWRQDAPAPQIAAEDGVGRGPEGESRRQTPRTLLWKIGFGRTPEVTRRPRINGLARRTRLGGGFGKAAPWYRRANF